MEMCDAGLRSDAPARTRVRLLRGAVCPYCGSAAQWDAGPYVQGTAILVPMACLACTAHWRAVYELTGYEGEEDTP